MIFRSTRFYYHLGLHYSQTGDFAFDVRHTFYYHLGLHYSQTAGRSRRAARRFYYHLGLHYSQTSRIQESERTGFYYHLGLHYSQTQRKCVSTAPLFYYHLGLHYSQTEQQKDLHKALGRTVFAYAVRRRAHCALVQYQLAVYRLLHHDEAAFYEIFAKAGIFPPILDRIGRKVKEDHHSHKSVAHTPATERKRCFPPALHPERFLRIYGSR